MDPNDDGSQGNESVNDGVFEEVAKANHEVYASRGQTDKAANDPAATGKTGGGTKTKEKAKPTEDEDEDAGDNAEGLDTQDFSRNPKPKQETEDEAKEEPSKTETKTEVPDLDWKTKLPPDPGEFQGKAPEPNEDGQIDPVEYTKHLKAEIKHDQRVDAYNSQVITATFDIVEKLLPEVKDNPAFQSAIRNTFNSTMSGDETIKMAKELRETLDSIAGENKAEGIKSAKASITVQKNAAVETKGATQKKKDTSKADNLTKRLRNNDTSAFEELMGGWLEKGKI